MLDRTGVLGIVLGRDSDLVTFLNARLPKEMVPIFAAGLLFVLPVNFKAGEFTLKWTQAANINWGTILLFGGGLTFGHLMVQTHLAEIIGESLVAFFGSNTLWTLTAVAIGTALVITEIASNTASTSMLVPVVISIATAAGISPIPPTLGVCFRGEPRGYDAGCDPAECDCLRHRIRPTAEHAESRGVLEYHRGRAHMADPPAPVSADGVRMKDKPVRSIFEG